jgi:hypothetical protein
LYPQKHELINEYIDVLKTENQTKLQKKRQYNLKKYMEYFNLRDDFIEPHYLPSLGESKYRSDFPFSDYLSLCLSNDLRFYFRFKKSSYFLIYFLLAYIMVTSVLSNTFVMSLLMSLIPVTCSFSILKARQRLNVIYRSCLSKSKHDELLNFADTENEL